MTKRIFDDGKSRVRVHTFAEGMLARLAHDLELICHGASGTLEQTGDGAARAQLSFPIARIEVAGALKGGHLDPEAIEADDRREIVAKMRDVVFRSSDPAAAVRVEAIIDGEDARVTVTAPGGQRVERAARVQLSPEGDGVRASGALDLLLSSLGAGAVRGPMNAFRVKDAVRVHFDVLFQ